MFLYRIIWKGYAQPKRAYSIHHYEKLLLWADPKIEKIKSTVP